MADKREMFRNYISQQGLKLTLQREIILDEFLRAAAHLSTEELYHRVRKKHSHIGYATVYRTLKLLAECGLAKERDFGGGQSLYEVAHRGYHHDHLICVECGEIIEFENARIEELQKQVAHEHGFVMTDHRLEIYGRCAKCSSS
ncbi:transcriptional repressor [Syntrophotalea acetylenica]|uniref:Fur family transcriptional regulator n=1 Tax=Syntrophotalea acetylenica TaxID=29542 RepID=UPI002A3595DA|nr:transcriptional repressor [Syntrophotalea acetylenica]MDY0261183.1 transcriptional repressor [Syntrophotalea acetylenica]